MCELVPFWSDAAVCCPGIWVPFGLIFPSDPGKGVLFRLTTCVLHGSVSSLFCLTRCESSLPSDPGVGVPSLPTDLGVRVPSLPSDLGVRVPSLPSDLGVRVPSLPSHPWVRVPSLLSHPGVRVLFRLTRCFLHTSVSSPFVWPGVRVPYHLTQERQFLPFWPSVSVKFPRSDPVAWVPFVLTWERELFLRRASRPKLTSSESSIVWRPLSDSWVPKSLGVMYWLANVDSGVDGQTEKHSSPYSSSVWTPVNISYPRDRNMPRVLCGNPAFDRTFWSQRCLTN